MEPFKKVKSIITPFNQVNVDTDQIVPKQFLKLVHKSGFGLLISNNLIPKSLQFFSKVWICTAEV